MNFEPVPNYVPFAGGVYEVAAGLRPLGTDFGQNSADQKVFQIATDWPAFHAGKLACRRERLGKYYVRRDFEDAAEGALVSWFVDRLTVEYQKWFTWADSTIRCKLTGDEIAIDDAGRLVRQRSQLSADYVDAVDALACQVSEDVCLVRAEGSTDWLAAAHVCSPGHWAPVEKIGRSFAAVHSPVAGIEPINRHAGRFVQTMIHRGPFVRFAWGVGTDDRPNHHPDPPVGVDAIDWRGRRFDGANPKLFVRVERQVMWGLPKVSAAVFTIRVSHLDGAAIRADPARRAALISAVRSMSADSLQYKGLAESVDELVSWLSSV